MARDKLFIFSIMAGVVITIALTWIAFSIDNKKVSHILLWQDAIFVYLVGSGPELGHDARENPRYEGTPIHTLILPIGFLLSIPVYSAVSYLVLRVSFRVRADRTERHGLNRTDHPRSNNSAFMS